MQKLAPFIVGRTTDNHEPAPQAPGCMKLSVVLPPPLYLDGDSLPFGSTCFSLLCPFRRGLFARLRFEGIGSHDSLDRLYNKFLEAEKVFNEMPAKERERLDC